MPPNQLPNRDMAWVSSIKLTDYLLSTTHTIGKTKAQFFRRHGYDLKNTDVLEGDLLKVAKNGTLIDSSSSPFGRKYVVDGSIVTPKGAVVALRTVWIMEPDDESPRFVTAYPA